MTDAARERIAASHARNCEYCVRDGLDCEHMWSATSDEDFAALPGLTARDVFEARLSRTALETCLWVIAEMITDTLNYTTGWDDVMFLDSIYPDSARTLDVHALGKQTVKAMTAVAHRMNRNDPFPARSTADEMILWFAITRVFPDHLCEADMDIPWCSLDDTLLEDLDFLFLFDPAYDGLENSAIAEQMAMTITGPAGRFTQFRPEGQ